MPRVHARRALAALDATALHTLTTTTTKQATSHGDDALPTLSTTTSVRAAPSKQASSSSLSSSFLGLARPQTPGRKRAFELMMNR